MRRGSKAGTHLNTGNARILVGLRTPDIYSVPRTRRLMLLLHRFWLRNWPIDRLTTSKHLLRDAAIRTSSCSCC